MAAQNGRMEMVNFLISRGANVNARDWVRPSFKAQRPVIRSHPHCPCCGAQNDRTPLSHAAQYGHAEVARALLAAGAQPSVRADSEKGGLAAIHYAAARGAVAVVRLLLQQPGADANARDEVRPSRDRCESLVAALNEALRAATDCLSAVLR